VVLNPFVVRFVIENRRSFDAFQDISEEKKRLRLGNLEGTGACRRKRESLIALRAQGSGLNQSIHQPTIFFLAVCTKTLY
jgi:hypothetical protein